MSYYLDLIDLYVIYQYADLNNREQSLMKTILVMNLEVKDNHEEAAIGGRLALELCQEVSNLIKKYIYIYPFNCCQLVSFFPSLV